MWTYMFFNLSQSECTNTVTWFTFQAAKKKIFQNFLSKKIFFHKKKNFTLSKKKKREKRAIWLAYLVSHDLQKKWTKSRDFRVKAFGTIAPGPLHCHRSFVKNFKIFLKSVNSHYKYAELVCIGSSQKNSVTEHIILLTTVYMVKIELVCIKIITCK